MKARLEGIEKESEMTLEFQKFGVGICLRTETPEQFEDARRALQSLYAVGLDLLKDGIAEYQFQIRAAARVSGALDLFRNGEKKIDAVNAADFHEMLEREVRLTIAEFARDKVFLHAGAVAWKGSAIIIPARSFSGKTALVKALVQKGAVYYSDEYAVLNADGTVAPFTKWLSLRGIIDDWRQLDSPVESIGGTIGKKSVPVGMILLARFRAGKKIPLRWRPRRLTQGAAIMEILPHTLAIRNNPQFSLQVLNNLTSRAIIVKTVRGEAAEFAETLLQYFDKIRNNSNNIA